MSVTYTSSFSLSYFSLYLPTFFGNPLVFSISFYIFTTKKESAGVVLDFS
ncbi:hypothetical protein FH5_04208 [Priestia endophytica]|nr:hypothetical protein FH5_04208 [Priestia endophytica]